MNEKQRTLKQNNSQYKYFDDLKDLLNEHGITQKMLLDSLKSIEVPNTKESIHGVWKAILKMMFNKDSTADQTTSEVSQVYDVLNKAIGEKHGIHLPWPNIINKLQDEDPLNNKYFNKANSQIA